MIDFNSFQLSNGLRVLVHEDPSVNIAVMNVLYYVGSRDESCDRTGLAHLLEHYMFGGSLHVPNYDTALQRVGGENNAFTSTDITNYYLTVSAENIATGFWLESDRMLGLSFQPEGLAIQKKVVVEEFKQYYLNQPYGDVWMKLSDLAYRTHPYRWTTIGKEPSHIENTSLEEVRNFFQTYYIPNNAVLVLAGNVHTDQVRSLSETWFGPIPAGRKKKKSLPKEPVQDQKRVMEVKADVPSDILYKTYHMPGRFDDNFYAVDMISAILGGGNSSRLYQKLVEEKQVFNSISSFTTETIDPGLLVITGLPKVGVSLEDAEHEINGVVHELIHEQTGYEKELKKAKNQLLTDLTFDQVDVLNRAINLAFSALSGKDDWIRKEEDRIARVSCEDIANVSRRILSEQNSCVLFYRSQK